MAIIQHDIYLSNYYQTEFEQLFYYMLPYTQRLFINLYIPLINQSTYKPLNATISAYDILQGAIERPFDQAEGGVQYMLIKNMPVYMVDANQLAETELKVDDSMIRFMQQSSFVARTYGGIIPQFVGGIAQLINPYSATMQEVRYFEITSEEKFSAYSYNIQDTLFKISFALTNKEFNPNVSTTYYYSQQLDTLVSYSELMFLQQSQSIYMYSIQQLRSNLHNYYFGQISFSNLYYILADIQYIAQYYSISFQQYAPATFPGLASISNVPAVQYFESDSVISYTLYYYYTQRMNLYSVLDSSTYHSNSFFTILSVTIHSLTYYMQNGYTYYNYASISTFNDGFDFWNQLLVACQYLNQFKTRNYRFASSTNVYY